MAYSDCPQVDMLTRRLVDAYQRMNDNEMQTSTVTNDLHSAIMEHKASCAICKRIIVKQPVSIAGTQRVA
ncbi:MAG: hypothetical protein PW789_18230 [Edaphobacter sp.]|uniref:hypothetical protein n=1 Tax=Edaphobacter sp. TaxID=1934404 RepID=UPI0023839A1B|nr:hypothetical protein [Edaphobacter sp.]MDE1178515.1 hypothetical protein [Edaphobacter sp.]